MIKKFLLACSALSLAFAANSAEKEIYVIKDGKMVNCNFVPSSEPVEDSYEIEESTNSAGEPMVKVKNPVAEYKQGFLYLPEAVDLSETWNMVFEYYFEEGTELTPDCYKRECWRFDLMADTLQETLFGSMIQSQRFIVLLTCQSTLGIEISTHM